MTVLDAAVAVGVGAIRDALDAEGIKVNDATLELLVTIATHLLAVDVVHHVNAKRLVIDDQREP